MAGSKVNSYSLGDSDPFAFTTLMESVTWQRKGYTAVSLTNYGSGTLPAIGAGSTVELGGSLYKFASEEAISTTDPDTSSTVVDGVVYVRLIPAGSAVTAAFTATAPTWDDSKYGYYGTGGTANDRVVAKMELVSGTYNDKKIIRNKDLLFDRSVAADSSVGDIIVTVSRNGNSSTAGFTLNTADFEILKPCTVAFSTGVTSYGGSGLDQTAIGPNTLRVQAKFNSAYLDNDIIWIPTPVVAVTDGGLTTNHHTYFNLNPGVYRLEFIAAGVSFTGSATSYDLDTYLSVFGIYGKDYVSAEGVV